MFARCCCQQTCGGKDKVEIKTLNESADGRLHRCVRSGDIDGAKKALDDGASADGPCRRSSGAPEQLAPSGGTRRRPDSLRPLLVAAAHAGPEMAVMLLDRAADPEARDGSGWTAIFFAAQRGDRGLCKVLVARAADPRRADSAGLTALDYAKDITTRRTLEREAQKPERECPKTPLEVVTDLEASREVSTANINVVDAAGSSVLIRATERRLEDICLAILRRSDFTEVNSRGALGRTALHTAGAIGLSTVCLEVLSHPDFCGVNTPDVRGRTALAIAAQAGCLNVVRAIIRHPDFWAVNVQDEEGRTALHAAAMAGRAAICEEVVGCAAFFSADAVDRWGNSALFYASRRGDLDVVHVLRAAGAHVIGCGQEVTDFNLAPELPDAQDRFESPWSPMWPTVQEPKPPPADKLAPTTSVPRSLGWTMRKSRSASAVV